MSERDTSIWSGRGTVGRLGAGLAPPDIWSYEKRTENPPPGWRPGKGWSKYSTSVRITKRYDDGRPNQVGVETDDFPYVRSPFYRNPSGGLKIFVYITDTTDPVRMWVRTPKPRLGRSLTVPVKIALTRTPDEPECSGRFTFQLTGSLTVTRVR